jgi:hypothetical protein
MAEGSTVRVKAGDEVRVHYHPPGQVVSFAEGVVSRVNVTTARGPGFLIDITREVFLGREQPVKPGYEHYVLYERPEDFPEKVEVLSQAQRELEGHWENGSEPDVAQEVEKEPEAETVPDPEPKPLTDAERDAEKPAPNFRAEPDGSQGQVEHQDGQRRGGRIISIFGRRRK